MVDKVACAFWSKADGIVEVDIRIPSGSNARSERLRLVSADHAIDWGHTLWVMPNLTAVPEPSKNWWIFRLERRAAQFVIGVPTIAAAEMWMVHHGHKF